METPNRQRYRLSVIGATALACIVGANEIFDFSEHLQKRVSCFNISGLGHDYGIRPADLMANEESSGWGYDYGGFSKAPGYSYSIPNYDYSYGISPNYYGRYDGSATEEDVVK